MSNQNKPSSSNSVKIQDSVDKNTARLTGTNTTKKK